MRRRLVRYLPVWYLGILVLAGLVVWARAPARAGAPTDQLKASVEQIVKVLENPGLRSEARSQERRAAIRKEAEGVFDFTETAKRALGRHWQALAEKDRQEFTSLFTDLIERAYISKIERYSGERIAYAGEAGGRGPAPVLSPSVAQTGTEGPRSDRRRQAEDRWLVYDVSVEG